MKHAASFERSGRSVLTQRAWAESEALVDLSRMRDLAPLTHCITNIVAANFTANVLLAVGASPAMVIAAEEVAEFAAIASGLLINVGTVTSEDARSMLLAAAAARESMTPWVLDPVAVGAVQYRTNVVKELLEHQPVIVRGNASEIIALTGSAGGGKGVDSAADSTAAIPFAWELAKRSGAVVAISGVVDYITDGNNVVSVAGGSALMTKVTGVGCALGAVMAAFLSGAGPLRAAASASLVFALAGERAAKVASRPGSFSVAFLDELSRVGLSEGD
jgi:hydroxyethylthiazole kinase